jgi:hypothetical protein
MTQPNGGLTPPQPVQIVNPLQWRLSADRDETGQPRCIVQLSQGQLQANLVLNPTDAQRLSDALAQVARQAGTSLILPG